MMNAPDYWQLFLETGAPEIYLMYQMVKRKETPDVPYNSRPGASGHGLQ